MIQQIARTMRPAVDGAEYRRGERGFPVPHV